MAPIKRGWSMKIQEEQRFFRNAGLFVSHAGVHEIQSAHWEPCQDQHSNQP